MSGKRKIESSIEFFEEYTDSPKFCMGDILSHSTDVFYRYDLRTFRYDYLSKSVIEQTGYSRDEVMACGYEWLIENLHPNDKSIFLDLFLACKNNTLKNDALTLEYRFRHKAGQYIWQNDAIQIIRDDQGRAVNLVGNARNITQRKQAEEELKRSEERFKRLSEATYEGICIHGQHGVILDVSQRFCELFGYTAEELKGIDCFKLAAPQSHKSLREHMESGAKGPYGLISLRKDGSTFPSEIRVGNIQLEEKNARVATIRDLTEQKQLQQQLVESEQKYRELYHNARAALFRTRISDGVLLDCSSAMKALLGYDEGKAKEYLGKFSVTESYVLESQRDVLMAKLKKNKKVEGFQIQLRHKAGRTLWVSLSAEIFPEQGYLEGIMHDITIEKVLSNAEQKVLALIMQGKSSKEVGRYLNRSVRTIEDHRSHIMHKLGVSNLVELTQIVLNHDTGSAWQ